MVESAFMKGKVIYFSIVISKIVISHVVLVCQQYDFKSVIFSNQGEYVLITFCDFVFLLGKR